MSPNVDPVLFVLDLYMKYTEEVVPLCMYIVGLLLYDSNPISKKCCDNIAHHYTLDDDSECPMDYQLSLLPKGFPSIYLQFLLVAGLSKSVLQKHPELWL